MDSNANPTMRAKVEVGNYSLGIGKTRPRKNKTGRLVWGLVAFVVFMVVIVVLFRYIRTSTESDESDIVESDELDIVESDESLVIDLPKRAAIIEKVADNGGKGHFQVSKKWCNKLDVKKGNKISIYDKNGFLKTNAKITNVTNTGNKCIIKLKNVDDKIIFNYNSDYVKKIITGPPESAIITKAPNGNGKQLIQVPKKWCDKLDITQGTKIDIYDNDTNTIKIMTEVSSITDAGNKCIIKLGDMPNNIKIKYNSDYVKRVWDFVDNITSVVVKSKKQGTDEYSNFIFTTPFKDTLSDAGVSHLPRNITNNTYNRNSVICGHQQNGDGDEKSFSCESDNTSTPGSKRFFDIIKNKMANSINNSKLNVNECSVEYSNLLNSSDTDPDDYMKCISEHTKGSDIKKIKKTINSNMDNVGFKINYNNENNESDVTWLKWGDHLKIGNTDRYW